MDKKHGTQREKVGVEGGSARRLHVVFTVLLIIHYYCSKSTLLRQWRDMQPPQSGMIPQSAAALNGLEILWAAWSQRGDDTPRFCRQGSFLFDLFLCKTPLDMLEYVQM